MTALMTRIRPRSLRTVRIHLPHRTQRCLAAVLPASEERLASGPEIETLRAAQLARVA